MKISRLILAGGLLALAACRQTGDGAGGEQAQAGAAASGPAVATVNGEPITREVFDYYVKTAAGKESAALTPEQREQALDSLVRAELVAQQAEKEGIDRTPETASLLALARMELLQQALRQKVLDGEVPTEQELRAEYETQIAALPSKEYKASHILVATEDFAKRLVAKLEKGESFEALARRESMDSSKQQGGDLGWFTPDRMVKPFADAVTALKKGEFTRTPVQTQFGWHVIRLVDTRDVAAPPFDTVKDRLGQIVLQKKFKAYSDGLLKTAKVEKNLDAAAPAPAAQSAPGGTPAS